MIEPFDALRHEHHLIALDIEHSVFPHRVRRIRSSFRRENPMYTLSKAKTEIDLVAKHATELAGHVIAMGGAVDEKLERFKTDILSVIDQKFAELARQIHGEGQTEDTSAVADLAAKVSLLTHGNPGPVVHGDPDHDAPEPSQDGGMFDGSQPGFHPHS